MFLTLNMGLTAWDQGDDPYDHGQLANNFQKIDTHDHASGNGTQIPSGGLKDRSVTTTKIALQAVTGAELSDNSVSNAKLQNNSVDDDKLATDAVTTDKIADNAVTADKIDPTFLPVGTVLMWGLTDALPGGGWEIMDGRPWSSIPNAMGYTTGNIPDMTNRFPLGAALSGTGTGTTTPPVRNATGGSHSTDLSHTHAVSAHTHSIANGGLHNHLFINGNGELQDLHLHPVATPTAMTALGTKVAAFVGGYLIEPDSTGIYDVVMETTGSHNHGGATGSAGGGNTDSQLTTLDKRPRFTGLLFVMRVR
jgi:hypothetical protein